MHSARITIAILVSTFLCSDRSFAQAIRNESRGDKIQKALENESQCIRRRAVLALALADGNERQIVDAVVHDGVDCYMAIRMLPRESLMHLPAYILDPSTRVRALNAITVLANAGLAHGDWVTLLRSSDKCDDNLKLILPVLERLASPTSNPDRHVLTMPALEGAMWSSDIAAMYRLVAACSDTRSSSIQVVRRRLRHLLSQIVEGGDSSNQWLSEVGGLAVCLLSAANSGPIDESTVSLLEDGCRAIERHLLPTGDTAPLEPAVRWTKWLGCGRHDTDLIEALRCSGNPDPAFDIRFLHGFNEYLGDCVLTAKDVPDLIAKAEDTHLDVTARVGAIRVLAYVGSTDRSVHDLFIRLIASDQQTVRLAAANYISLCVERAPEWGRLHAAVVKQLDNEVDFAVRLALKTSEQCLREF